MVKSRWMESDATDLSRLLFTALITIGAALNAPSFTSPSQLLAQDLPASAPIKPRPLSRIPPGTLVFDKTTRGFSDLILFVKGNLKEGDLNAVSDTTRYYGDLFNLVYVANTQKKADRYELESIAVGFSSKINNRDVVIDSSTARRLGLKLSFIGKSVLSGNEKALDEIVLVAQNQHCAIVDAPAVMYYKKKHRKMVVRFFIWVSSASGKLGTAAWLLDEQHGRLQFANQSFNFLAPEMIEDRVLHVDGSQFTLGIPSSTAFGIVSIPGKQSFPLTTRLKRAGALKRFDEKSFNELIVSVADAIGQR